MQQILTASRPGSGRAVWLAADHSWAERIEDAEIARDETTAEKLTWAGRAALLKHEVVDVDFVEIEIVAGRVRPQGLREHVEGAIHGGDAKAA